MQVAFKFLEIGFFNLAHEHGDFIRLKEELEMYATYAFADEMGLDIKNIVAAPHATCGVGNIVDGKGAFPHGSDAEVYSACSGTLFKRNCRRAMFIQCDGKLIKT